MYFHLAIRKTIVFPEPVFTKLANAQHIYAQICYDDFQAIRTMW